MTSILRIDIVGNARDAQAAINSTDNSLDKLGKTGSKLGPLLKAGALAGVAGLALLGKAAFDSASNLQQSMGAVDSVFGKHANLIHDLAKGAADSVGLAASEYGNLASLLGSQLQNMGRSSQQAANETENLVKLGSDLAATYGGSVSDAVSAVSSLLKGERDPIEKYGASIKAADIEAQLAAKGLDNLTGKAKTQAEATAALEILYKQTGAAQGAFGRESETAAGQQARLSANIENTKAKLGEALLPVMTAVFKYINEQALPAAKRLGAELQERFGPTIQAIGAWIRDDLVPALRRLWDWFETKILPQLRKAVMPILEAVAEHFRELKGTVDDNRGSLEKIGKFLQKVAEFGADLAPIVGETLAVAFGVMSEAIQLVVDVISTLVDWIDKAIDGAQKLGDAISKIPGAGLVAKGFGAVFDSPVAGQLGDLAGRYAGTRPGVGLAQASAGVAGAGGLLAAAGAGAGYTLVDARRTVNVTISDALDPVAVAAAVRRVLREDDVRSGRAFSFAPATGWAG